MSSTSVHSNQNKHIVGGQTIPGTPDESIKMPPESAGIGPSVVEVREGKKAIISAQSNLVIKDGKKVVGRATMDGQVLSGDGNAVKRALKDDKDIGR